MEPHTHTKRHAGNFFMVVASGMARGRVRRTSVRPSHFMTFLHEAIFAQLLGNGVRTKSFDMANWTLASHFFSGLFMLIGPFIFY